MQPRKLRIIRILKKLKFRFSGIYSFLRRMAICLGIAERKPEIPQRIAEFQESTYGRKLAVTRDDFDTCRFSPEELERIAYYLGDIGRGPVVLDGRTRQFTPGSPPWRLLLTDQRHLHDAAVLSTMKDGYTLPILHLFRLLPEKYQSRRFLYAYGDRWRMSPYKGVISKTRKVGDSSVSLLNLNPIRHWQYLPQVRSHDLRYAEKRSAAIWRGADTGRYKPTTRRADFVQQFYNRKGLIDIGYSFSKDPGRAAAPYMKDPKPVPELLRYKMLISLEGNDVASGLKWMLYSQSVVLMPRPTTCSWLMEDRLEPFIHYIPLADDFADLDERVEWAMANESDCEAISMNATHFIEPFLDWERQSLLECEVLRRYLENIRIEN